MSCVRTPDMMKTRFHPSIILMILYCLASYPEGTGEQGNRNMLVSGWKMSELYPLKWSISSLTAISYNSEFIWMKEWSGKQVFVSFPASDLPYPMIINGFRFGSDPGSGVASEYNITPFLNKQSNTLELQAEYGSPRIFAHQGWNTVRDASS